MSRLDSLVSHAIRLYCIATRHDWRRVVMTIGESEEGYSRPVVWRPRRICARCGALEAEVGFSDKSTMTSETNVGYDVWNTDIDIDGSGSRVVISEWD